MRTARTPPPWCEALSRISPAAASMLAATSFGILAAVISCSSRQARPRDACSRCRGRCGRPPNCGASYGPIITASNRRVLAGTSLVMTSRNVPSSRIVNFTLMWVLLVNSDGVRCARFCVSGVSTTATLMDPPPFDDAGLWSSSPQPGEDGHRQSENLLNPSRPHAPSLLLRGRRGKVSHPPAERAAARRAGSRGCFVGGDELQRDHRAVVGVTALLPAADDAVDVRHQLVGVRAGFAHSRP